MKPLQPLISGGFTLMEDDGFTVISMTFGMGAGLAAVAGMIAAHWSGYFTVEYKDGAAFSILVLVLIFRPSSLLGKPEIEKV